jgi:hypothetical protein
MISCSPWADMVQASAGLGAKTAAPSSKGPGLRSEATSRQLLVLLPQLPPLPLRNKEYDIVTILFDIVMFQYDIVTFQYDIITFQYDIVTFLYGMAFYNSKLNVCCTREYFLKLKQNVSEL